MTELEARRVLLLRAFEQPLAPPWTAEHADAVTRQALQQLGETAEAAPFIAARAGLGVQRLAQREPAVDVALAATGPQRGLRFGVIVLAALAGTAADAVGASQRINILAPPLFALLLWNLAVYAALAVAALRPVHDGTLAQGLLRRVLSRWLQAAVQRVALPSRGAATAPLARFVADWWRLAGPLNGARLTGLLHLAAATFAGAALASLYVRGLGLEYRAGWDSTFLTPASVHGLLSLLFAPALAISGAALPDAEALARLRFASGPGENAAPWIHLQALTVGLFVLLPRALLTALASGRARRLANAFVLPLDEPDFARLARQRGGEPLTVDVLPYSYTLPPGARSALQSALERLFGGAVSVRLAGSVPIGAEDDAVAPAPAALPLFALTATPERETHGAFAVSRGCRRALIDESGFRQRFGEARLEQRRDAWRRMLADLGVEPVFVDLGSP